MAAKDDLDNNGYVLVRGVVPVELCEAVRTVVWATLGADAGDPSTWPPSRPGGMIELYHDQALWDVRQHPAVYRTFADLLQQQALWVSIDRVSMKPPADDSGFMHWDCDPRQPLPFRWVQGLVFLADTTEEQGGFWCLPDVYRNLNAWLIEHAETPMDFSECTPTKVPGRAGDLLVWSVHLPHGNAPNRSNVPRMAQYLTMYPAHGGADPERERMWRERIRPGIAAEKGTCELGEPAQLTKLGRKLAGIDAW